MKGAKPKIPQKPASTLAWRRGVLWELSAPGCWINIEGSEFGTVITVYAHEDRFADQPKMVAGVEIRGCSGSVRKFRNQATIRISVMAEKGDDDERD